VPLGADADLPLSALPEAHFPHAAYLEAARKTAAAALKELGD